MAATDFWRGLTPFSETFTCYSAAIATWIAYADDAWPRTLNPGLWLTLTEEADDLFGFSFFRPGLRAELGLVRTQADDDAAGTGVDAVLAELEHSGRVIVAGDGFRLPWHVAYGRKHVPHWYVIVEGPTIIDPFACRNELGVQKEYSAPVALPELPELVGALPSGDPVYELRESLGLGDDLGPRGAGSPQWFVRADVGPIREPAGLQGPDAVLRLARHFREQGGEPRAYRQADDLWSIARHRAFLSVQTRATAERTGDAELAAWVGEHAEPLSKRWAHMAPLIMQATLALGVGRPVSDSVPKTLEAIADLERDAAGAFPGDDNTGSIWRSGG